MELQIRTVIHTDIVTIVARSFALLSYRNSRLLFRYLS